MAIEVPVGPRGATYWKIIDLLRRHTDLPLQALDVAIGTDMSPEAARKALWRMRRNGAVLLTTEGYVIGNAPIAPAPTIPSPPDDDFYRHYWGA